MSQSFITAIGHYLPPLKVTNEDLPVRYSVDSEGIEKRTGIRSRHYVEGRVYTSDLAKKAAEIALENGQIESTELDCIITATLSPDYCFPGIGVYLQDKLGCGSIPAYDVRNQCSGFLYALNTARAFAESSIYRNILVVGAEVHSHALGKTEMHSHITPLFGDGAGAVIVTNEKRKTNFVAAIEDIALHSDGSGADKLRQRVWDISLSPFMDYEQLGESAEQMWYAEMDGQYIFRRAVKEMSRAVKQTLKRQRLGLDDIHLVIAHQANLNINNTVAAVLGLDAEKMPYNIDRVGNTTAASIPLLLSELHNDGKIAAGNKLMLVAFGSGLTWGTALLTVLRDDKARR